MLNNFPIKMIRGTRVEINENEYDITPGIQNVNTDSSCNRAKSMTDKEKLVFRDILQRTDFYNRIPKEIACQVVINILKMILITMLEEF